VCVKALSVFEKYLRIYHLGMRALVHTVMNLPLPHNAWNFLTSWETFSFSTTLIREASQFVVILRTITGRTRQKCHVLQTFPNLFCNAIFLKMCWDPDWVLQCLRVRYNIVLASHQRSAFAICCWG